MYQSHEYCSKYTADSNAAPRAPASRDDFDANRIIFEETGACSIFRATEEEEKDRDEASGQGQISIMLI